ncbi:hypothetical protein AURDEDRAFT_171275 [Auricularia subglabra TFB-10046 SS5]|nr:hypothetical protein AURDEDRAFT_171275 [Auricularia subglabra TFB-10046 SS5]
MFPSVKRSLAPASSASTVQALQLCTSLEASRPRSRPPTSGVGPAGAVIDLSNVQQVQFPAGMSVRGAGARLSRDQPCSCRPIRRSTGRPLSAAGHLTLSPKMVLSFELDGAYSIDLELFVPPSREATAGRSRRRGGDAPSACASAGAYKRSGSCSLRRRARGVAAAVDHDVSSGCAKWCGARGRRLGPFCHAQACFVGPPHVSQPFHSGEPFALSPPLKPETLLCCARCLRQRLPCLSQTCIMYKEHAVSQSMNAVVALATSSGEYCLRNAPSHTHVSFMRPNKRRRLTLESHTSRTTNGDACIPAMGSPSSPMLVNIFSVDPSSQASLASRAAAPCSSLQRFLVADTGVLLRK